MLFEGGFAETKYIMSHQEGVLDRRCLKGLECVPNRIKEYVLRSVKGSPRPNASRPSQREFLEVSKSTKKSPRLKGVLGLMHLSQVKGTT